MELTSSEISMWETPVKRTVNKLTDDEINNKYRMGEQRIVTETNREKIPNFVDALKKPKYMEVRPFYQRRNRWDDKRQSKLIESFIMNIPVPPLFLYEKEFNRYEVMDGQQRITALKGFYDGEFKLKGLEIWPELNGRTYSTLPSQVRQGLDRRSISYTVVLRESTAEEEDAVFLRQTVFERLNTGGVKLEHQEIRNSLFQSEFNDLLIELTKTDLFRDAFGMPRSYPEEDKENSGIRKFRLYEKLGDAELILRFFALRHVEHFTRGMQGFLDLYMSRARAFHREDISSLRDLFLETMSLVTEIYGDKAFRPFNTNKAEWDNTPSKAFFDAIMVAFSNYVRFGNDIIPSKNKIVKDTKNLFITNPEGTFTGRGNAKKDIKQRIEKVETMIANNLT
jgi:hypothetical protein